MTYVLKWGAAICIAASVLLCVWHILSIRPLTPPDAGPLGAARAAARRENELLRALEPALLLLAAWMALLPAEQLRERIRAKLHLADHWLGLREDEFLALSLASAVAGGAFAAVAATIGGYPIALGLIGLLLGSFYPSSQLDTLVQNRQEAIGRGLPSCIDLAALSMEAGLDFPGSLQQLVRATEDKASPLMIELQRILQDLELGQTRVSALQGFAERAPIEGVRDFVGAVVQAEKKGTPLVETLKVQAAVMRDKRATRAEESAAQTAVKLFLPIMLVVAAVMILMIGPAAIKLIQGKGAGFGI